ncbi:MAG: T9SS type A sorting domain-containing protein, partial [Phaeodactylibacter sp.]|nr:T9SS type A sorting domain-containing protein [Phaeodactylibacter sp.]
FHVIEDGVEGAFCLPSYSLSLSKNFEQGGTVSFEPEQAFYEAGTEITLTATANSGYFFQSWSGGETSTELVHTFNISRNANVEGLFYPDGTQAEAGVIGYATVQDDEGTPYLMTGGLFGDTVLASNFNTLKAYLESDLPYVVTVEDHIISTGTINIASDKTLLGLTDSSHLEGIRIKINSSDNVILRNMTFSKVIQFDEIEINNSHHIWIDGCEFFTDLDHGSEYYDGLLDIKNAARFITVSNTEFHDHFKAVLISSGDDSFQDTSIRITFHHNYFHNLGSRTPLLRFGKAHIFNNYFRSCSSGVNSRMGACIRVEENFFFSVSNALRTDMSATVGYFEVLDNIFEASSYVADPTCELDVPYEYTAYLDEAADVPLIVAGEDPLNGVNSPYLEAGITIFPNPASAEVQLVLDLREAAAEGHLSLYNLLGRQVQVIADGPFAAGSNPVYFSVAHLPAGHYFVQLETPQGRLTKSLIIQ